MNIFQFTTFHSYFLRVIKTLGEKSVSQKILAQKIGVHPVVITQVLKGQRSLAQENILTLAEYLQLSPDQSDYLFLLYQKEKAGTQKLKDYFQNKIELTQSKQSEIKNRVDHKLLPREVQLRFYSSWKYSAVRMTACLDGVQNADEISHRLHLTKDEVTDIIFFLEATSLIVRKKGKWEFGTVVTHVGKEDELSVRHRQNWIERAHISVENYYHENVHYSGIIAFDEIQKKWLEEKLLEVIAEMTKKAIAAPSEKAFCLNLNLFRVS